MTTTEDTVEIAERVVVDCSGRIGQEAVEAMYREALEAARTGDLEMAGNLARQADAAAGHVKDGPTEIRVPLTDQEVAQRQADAHEAERYEAAALRLERDALLAASDWVMLPDAPLTDTQRAAWREYRQALRDLPATPDAGWPTPPKAT
jgi:hypothetical protein